MKLTMVNPYFLYLQHTACIFRAFNLAAGHFNSAQGAINDAQLLELVRKGGDAVVFIPYLKRAEHFLNQSSEELSKISAMIDDLQGYISANAKDLPSFDSVDRKSFGRALADRGMAINQSWNEVLKWWNCVNCFEYAWDEQRRSIKYLNTATLHLIEKISPLNDPALRGELIPLLADVDAGIRVELAQLSTQWLYLQSLFQTSDLLAKKFWKRHMDAASTFASMAN